MKPVRIFNVIPSLPAPLERLRELAYNLRWAWHHETIELFRRLDSDLWEATGHNPVRMLGEIDQERLTSAAQDEAFLAHLDREASSLAGYLSGDRGWFRLRHSGTDPATLAYFSAEFGLTECLSIFAGGLGVLAGDHLKSASDLGLPLVGVGLLYQQGYFRQRLNSSGWQQEDYIDNDFRNLPLQLERDSAGDPLTVRVRYPGREVAAQIWRVQVGRLRLYLLDTNIDGNQPLDRDLTDQLYGGDSEMRIRQEILLGIGGFRALEKLGIEPTVYHMNEGHSAFLAVERIRRLMERHRLTFREARQAASAGLVFTTHTPVPAGHDYFHPDLVTRHFGEYAQALGLGLGEFLALGRRNPADAGETFCMTVLALRLAAYCNGVSKLHGDVSRQMWEGLWPAVPRDEIPIGHITNGVHFRSWISYEMNQLYDRYLGPKWREGPAEQPLWQRVESIPAEELWRTHERRRERLVAFARRRLRAQLERRSAGRPEVEAADEVLDPEALTIGFARRFATYKRATLVLRDVDRLARILGDPARPVQLIFAGKAHPRDEAGKELIRQIVSLARRPEFRRRLVFLEDYDMAVARYLVQGVDVWLNTPQRPQEASGTSGMKALANGALNLSTLDGWWDEAWEMQKRKRLAEPPGWAIGTGQDGADLDHAEALALYDLLERDVAPSFYDRRADGLPRRWIARMKASIGTLCYFFNTHRMVQNYTESFYLPAHDRFRQLLADDCARARALAEWSARVERGWSRVHVEVGGGSDGELPVGGKVRARALVQLGDLTPEDVAVELYLGRVDADSEIVKAIASPMEPVGQERGVTVFEASGLACAASGLHGYTVRVLPRHRDLVTTFLPGLIAWATSGSRAAGA